jgi:hypothetical protein
MLGRIRDAKCTKFVWVKEWVAQSEQSHSKSPFTRKVGQAIEKMLCSDITDTISGIDRDQDIISKLWAIIQDSKNAHFEASNQIQAITNFERSNLRECVRESLEASGYPIRLCTLNPAEEAKERVKDATEATKRQNCHDIFTAEKIAPEFADELSKKFDARWEERTKVIQASYRSRLPGIDETQSWTEEFIYQIRYDNPDFINQQELFWLYSHPEEANRMNLERYHRIAQKERTFIGNIKSRMARVRALRAIKFETFLNPEKVWEEDSPEIVQLVERCKDEKIAAALGRHPGKQARIRFLGSLLKMLGLKLRGQKVKSEDGDYRIYQLDRDTLSDSYRRDALQCLDRRWENYVKKEVEVLDWEPVLNPQSESQEVEIIDNTTCQQAGDHSQQAKPTQSQSGQGFDPVPRTPTEYIYNLGASWNQSDLAERQGLCRQVGEVTDSRTDLERLVDALEGVGSLEEFSEVVGGREVSIVENAIAFAPSQPRRQQLFKWLEQIGSGKKVENLADELVQGLSRCCNIPSFRQLTHGCSDEVIRAAVGRLNPCDRERVTHYWQEVRRRGNPITDRCQVEVGSKPSGRKASIGVNDFVRFTNPSRLKVAQIFEGICLRVIKILEPLALADCVLPDGREETFGLDTLELVT